jgi:NAD+ synthetase
MRILLAQINPTVVDFDGNLAAIAAACDRARAAGDELVLTPELALTGYPPLDLMERADMLAAAVDRLPALAAASRGLVLVAGLALPADFEASGQRLRPAVNAAAVFVDGQRVAIVHKRLLPTYDVFDEDRYFQAGDRALVMPLNGRRVGITICEDIWSHADDGPPRYDIDPVGELVAAGADCILNLSASPFDLGKAARRLRLVHGIASRHGVPIAYCNAVGGNDALIFDGRSFAVDGAGRLLVHGEAFTAADVRCVLPQAQAVAPAPLVVPPSFQPSLADEARAALVLGLRDYVNKCGFQRVLLGLSGGIDSAVTAALAVEALGPDAVMGVAMPGPYSSPGSVTDALALAERLGIRCPVVPITGLYDASLATLDEEWQRVPGADHDIAEQNIQARARGLLLMALSNRTGAMLLTTGNKSELAVGYCTLYGDMNGGLAVIGDLPKMLVYDVAGTYNQEREVIPASTLRKAPSAELAPNQTDQDSLPPYPVLDAILDLHVMQQQSTEAILGQGFDPATVRRVVRLVELNEYKRRQAAPVLRVTRKAFGGGRRIPMARKMPPAGELK